MFHSLLCLLTLLFIQTPSEETPYEKKWASELKRIVEEDRKNPPHPEAILFVGSSSIRLWNLKESFPDWKTVNHGFGGSTIRDNIELMDKLILPLKPNRIVFYAGDNDLAANPNQLTAEQVFAAYKEFVQKLHRTLPECNICYLSIKPSPQRWHLWPEAKKANKMISDYVSSHPMLGFIDVGQALLDESGLPITSLYQKDQLHLNEKGYERWSKIVLKVFEK